MFIPWTTMERFDSHALSLQYATYIDGCCHLVYEPDGETVQEETIVYVARKDDDFMFLCIEHLQECGEEMAKHGYHFEKLP